MRAEISEGCIGCGLCASTCPDVFRMSGEGLAEVYAEPTPDNFEAAIDAAYGCPVSVISVE